MTVRDSSGGETTTSSGVSDESGGEDELF